jgi:chromosome partitioning protein
VNQKGGVGKTTTAVNLAAGLALAERPTSSSISTRRETRQLAGRPEERPPSNGLSCSSGRRSGREGDPRDGLPGLKLLPADIDLVGAEIELVGVERREHRLRDVLATVSAAYDYIIIDCPPSLGLLTINALVAADRVLVPLQCEFYALEGLAHLLKKTVKLVRDKLNPSLDLLGILLTMFDGRTSLTLQIREEVNRYFPGQVFDTIIPRNVRLTEAPSHGRPVMLHDLKSSGSAAYLELTREVLNHAY